MTDRNSNGPKAGRGAQDHITPSTPTVTAPYEVLDERIEAQRDALFNMMAIVGTVAYALNGMQERDEEPIYSLRRALRMAYEQGDDIAAKLDPAVIFDLPGVAPEVQVMSAETETTGQEPSRTVLTETDRENVLAFFAGVRPLKGCAFGGEIEERIQAGRRLVGGMISINGIDALTVVDCADILCWISGNESSEPLDWNVDENPHRACGLMSVLQVIECALRTPGEVQP